MRLSAQHRGAARFGGDSGLFTLIFQYFGNLFDSIAASIEGQFARYSPDIYGLEPILPVEI